MPLTRTQKIGIFLLPLSLAIGIGGSVWSLFGAFASLGAAENAGLGAVGSSVRDALIFTVVGLVGLLVGALLLVVGRPRSE